MSEFRRLMMVLGVVLTAITVFAASAQARPVSPQRQRVCLQLPRQWLCIDVQLGNRADAFHAVVPRIPRDATRLR